MSILSQKKVTLIGISSDAQQLMHGLQNLACMHVLPVSPAPKEPEKIVNPTADKAYKALKFLSEPQLQRRQIKHKDDFDVNKVVNDCLALQLELRRTRDKKELLEQRLRDIEPWGNIEYAPNKALDDYLFWYYVLPLDQRRHLRHLETPWSIVYQDHKQAYVVLIAKNEPSSDILPVPRTHLGAKSKKALLEELETTELKLDDLNTQRYSLTRYIYLLSVNLAKADNEAAYANAMQKSFAGEDLFVVHGWVPERRIKDVADFAQQNLLTLIVEAPQKGEQPPTLLKQPKKMTAARDLALFYQVPGYDGWDPSKLLFASFSLFFAMILADAGYGLLLGTALLLSWKKLGSTAKGKAYRLLGLSLTLSTIAYGALVGSYFGVSPAADSTLAHIHLLDINNFDVMMKISIVIGALHLGIANLSMAWVTRHSSTAIAKIGWLFLIYSGLFYWLASGNPTGEKLSFILGGLGVLAIVLFSSERPVIKTHDYLFRILEGIFNLKSTLNAFGDVLSYMRLFALGLASASLAITFNGLAKDAYEAISGGGLLIAILILVIGHALNLVLSLMSGVVHGLRLNYIEFYNWGQTEEGTAFQTFAKKEVNDERE